MEPTRTRTARDIAAEQARSRPSTQFAQQYPAYPEQAQQLRRPPQRPPASRDDLFGDLIGSPAPNAPVPHGQQAARLVPPPAALRAEPAAPLTGAKVVRRAIGLVAFVVLTGLSLPLHVLAVFFVYVQIESPADTASAVPLLGGMFLAVFVALCFVGLLTQLIGGFPGRWRARVTFSLLSAVIALAVAYGAAITQF